MVVAVALVAGRPGVDDGEGVRRRLALEHPGAGDDLVVGHVPDVDVDPVDPLDGTHRLDDPAADLGPRSITGERGRERHQGRAPVERDTVEHPQFGERTPQFGLLHGREGLSNIGFLGALTGHTGSPGRFPLSA